MSSTDQVLFIHGMFMTGRCWAGWVRWFEERGYRCQAPDWPGRQGAPAALRAHPDPALRELTLAGVFDHFRAHVRGLPAPPILIGHSMGGLVVQKLLEEGLGAIGVAIDSAPPQWVTSMKWSFLKSGAPGLLPTRKPIVPTLAQFKYAFMHTSPDEEVRAVYESQVVPESRRVARGPITSAARIDFARERAPLLFIAGSDDHIIPPSLNRANAARYRKNPSVTELVTFEGRTHYLIGQPGWEEIASRVHEWIGGRARKAA